MYFQTGGWDKKGMKKTGSIQHETVKIMKIKKQRENMINSVT